MDLADNDAFELEIAAYRPVLFRLALVQLQDRASAEDAVQEAIVAALSGRRAFKGRASVKTWLISILKYKILDIVRSRRRYQLAPGRSDEASDADAFDALFDDSGCWREPMDSWSDPQTVVERVAFFQVLETCLSKLPEKTSRAFMMREWLEIDVDEIQGLLGVTPGHLRILLYRARMQLRLCVDINWERG